MNEFVIRVQEMFKSYLNYPVPALLIEENNKILTFLQACEQNGGGNHNYHNDKIPGEMGETLVINFLLMNKHVLIKKNDAVKKKDLIKFDLLMEMIDKNDQKKSVTYEIKTDLKEVKTHRIAIEEYCRGQASGINAWDCDYVTYVLPSKRLIGFIKLEKLKRLLPELKAAERGKSYLGGDDGKTQFYCILWEDFQANFKLVYL